MIPGATLCHVSPGRLRLRIPTMRGDAEYFRGIEGRLSGHFSDVEANSVTGSVLVKGSHISRDRLRTLAVNQGLFELEVAHENAARASPFTDWHSAAAAIFVVLGLVQLYRGRILTPAATLLWYAIEAWHWGQAKG